MDRQEKIEIINYYEKNDFHEFLEHDHSGRILQLLDDEGIDILRNSPKREDRINYILSFSPYLGELFKQILINIMLCWIILILILVIIL